MPWESGNYSNISGVLERVAERVQNTSFMGAGNEWSLVHEYRDGSGHFPYTGDAHTYGNGKGWIFEVPGPSTNGDLYISMTSDLHPAEASNTANVLFSIRKTTPVSGWLTGVYTYRGSFSGAGYNYNYGDVVSDSANSNALYVCTSTTGVYSSSTAPYLNESYWMPTVYSPFHKFAGEGNAPGIMSGNYVKCRREDGTNGILYWLIANEKRLILILKSDTRYTTTYVGCYDATAPIEINNFPYILTYNSDSTTESYSSTGLTNFPQEPADNYRISSPLGSNYSSITTPGNAEEMYDAFYSQKSNGKYILIPQYLHFYRTIGGATESDYESTVLGVLDGVFRIASTGLTSGDTVVIDSVDYLCIENVYRSTSDAFCAIRLD